MELKNHYDTTSLSFCKDDKAVLKELEAITGSSGDFALKTRLLYYHMGITQTFASTPNEKSMEQEEKFEFDLAFHHFLRVNKLI